MGRGKNSCLGHLLTSEAFKIKNKKSLEKLLTNLKKYTIIIIENKSE